MIFLPINIIAQPYKSGADTLIFFKAGKGQNVGQDKEYFPNNVFGLPDTNAREDFQSADPNQICSLGFGGEIILGFKDYIVFDGEGPDFTIFENAFINPVTKKVFAEPAKVSVSFDGINYTEFPYDSVTLEGCAGKTPTYGNKDPFNPEESGGDKFDLATIGLKKIRYIKITDISEYLKYNSNYLYYDPIISGFDLDAIVGLNLEKDVYTTNVCNKLEINELNIITSENTIRILSYLNNSDKILKLYNISGQEIIKEKFTSDVEIKLNYNTNNLYFILIILNDKIITFKIII